MAELNDFLDAIISRHIAADEALYNGDPEPRIAMWSANEPISLFSAGGESISGSSGVFAFFHSLATRYSTASNVAFDLEAAEIDRNLGYTVGLERFRASLEGSSVIARVIRATQIYRREGDEWKIVHRHGDSTPRKNVSIRD